MTNSQIDKYRWALLLLQIVIGSVCTFVYILSVYFGPIEASLGWSIDKMILTFTVAMWMGTPSFIVAGILRDKFGNRNCIFAGGIFYGIFIVASAFAPSVEIFIFLQGVCGAFCMFLLQSVGYANAGMFFPDKRGLATGLLMAGMAVGGAIMPPVSVFLMGSVGIMSSIAVQGGIYAALIVVCGLFMINPREGYKPAGWHPEELSAVKSSETGVDTPWHKMIKTSAFWMILFTLAFINVAPNMAMSNTAGMAMSALGIDDMSAALFVSETTIMTGVSGIFVGLFADKIGSFKTLAGAAVIEVIVILIGSTAGAGSPLAFGCVIAALGIGYGAVTTVYPVLTMNAFGEKHFGVNYGVLGINGLICSTIAPQLTVQFPVYTGLMVAAAFAVVGFFLAIGAQKAVASFTSKGKAELAAQQSQEAAAPVSKEEGNNE